MATIKSEYYRFNGVSWDIHYFKTTMDMVDGAKEYIASRGQNLVTNGTGLLNSNQNFSGYIFDATEAYGAAGSFKDTLSATRVSDEFMPVDISKKYKMSFWAKQVKGNPTKALTRHYSFLDMYDVDKKSISREMVWPFANTTTTLAQDLKIGDTVVYLTSAANYNNAAGSATHYRKFMLWGYKNSFGYEYPVGTYTRYYTPYNTWSDGAVNYTANTITLNSPWTLVNPDTPDGRWPAGTYISNGTSGGYTYKGLSNTQVPEEWTEYTGVFNPTEFRPGTAYIRLGWLNHYAAGQTAITVDNNTIYYSNIQFGLDVIYDGDSRLTNARPASDVYAWAKAATKPSYAWTEIGSKPIDLVETNNKLLLGSTTQYIRLAYGPITRGYIKHGGGDEYELYHTGNLNPSTYMPKTGGTFTGNVSINSESSLIIGGTLFVNGTIGSDNASIQFSSGLDAINFNNVPLINVGSPFNAGDAVNKAYVDGLLTNMVKGSTYPGAYSPQIGSLLFQGVYGWQTIAPGSLGQVLTVGSGSQPAWQTPAVAATVSRSVPAMYVKRIFSQAYNASGWTLRYDAGTGTGTSITGNTTAWTNIALGYTPATTDRFMIEFGNSSSNTLENGVCIVGYGTFSSTAGMSLVSYEAYESVSENMLNIAKYSMQWYVTGSSLGFRYPTKTVIG
jgi:hypothetical protein